LVSIVQPIFGWSAYPFVIFFIDWIEYAYGILEMKFFKSHSIRSLRISLREITLSIIIPTQDREHQAKNINIDAIPLISKAINNLKAGDSKHPEKIFHQNGSARSIQKGEMEHLLQSEPARII